MRFDLSGWRFMILFVIGSGEKRVESDALFRFYPAAGKNCS